MMHAGMPITALISSMPMPGYGETFRGDTVESWFILRSLSLKLQKFLFPKTLGHISRGKTIQTGYYTPDLRYMYSA
jgi:hypothetical protein